MICLKCGKSAFTIGGNCADCDPARHGAFGVIMGFMDDAEASFKAATGRDALTNWNEFEAWLEREGGQRPEVVEAFRTADILTGE